MGSYSKKTTVTTVDGSDSKVASQDNAIAIGRDSTGFFLNKDGYNTGTLANNSTIQTSMDSNTVEFLKNQQNALNDTIGGQNQNFGKLVDSFFGFASGMPVTPQNTGIAVNNKTFYVIAGVAGVILILSMRK